jgi:hypothetical protein
MLKAKPEGRSVLKCYSWQRPLRFAGNSAGHPPSAINGTGPFVGPPEANRLRLFSGGFGLGDADALLLGDALAEGSTGGALLGAGVLAATLPLVP